MAMRRKESLRGEFDGKAGVRSAMRKVILIRLRLSSIHSRRKVGVACRRADQRRVEMRIRSENPVLENQLTERECGTSFGRTSIPLISLLSNWVSWCYFLNFS